MYAMCVHHNIMKSLRSRCACSVFITLKQCMLLHKTLSALHKFFFSIINVVGYEIDKCIGTDTSTLNNDMLQKHDYEPRSNALLNIKYCASI